MTTFDPKTDLEKIHNMFPGCTSIVFANLLKIWELKYKGKLIRLEPIALKIMP